MGMRARCQRCGKLALLRCVEQLGWLCEECAKGDDYANCDRCGATGALHILIRRRRS
jgi:hypothetical protein